MGRSLSVAAALASVGSASGFGNNDLGTLLGRRVYGIGGLRVWNKAGTYLFTVPFGVYRIRVRVHGAGASGAAVYTISTYSSGVACGGGAGGFAMGEFDVVPGTTYLVTVGAGGVAVWRDVGGVTPGLSGGTSSFGTLLSATGGSPGPGANAAGGTITLAGAAGGVGIGGSVQYEGGRSGSLIAIKGATGGGSAATVLGPGYPSGDVLGSGATGGASVGASSAAVSSGLSAGAGVSGPSVGAVGGPNTLLECASAAAGAGNPDGVLSRWSGDVLGGGGGSPGYAGGPGAGGGGASTGAAGAGGVHGGGGAASPSGTPGPGGQAAGGGGAHSHGAPVTSAAGGDGLVVVEW